MADLERNAFDSQAKSDYRPSPRDARSGRNAFLDGMLRSGNVKKVNSIALCYLVLLVLVVTVSFQLNVRQRLKLQRLARSSKQWEGLYSQSLEEIIDWKRKLEHEREVAAEFSKNIDILEGTLRRVRKEKSAKEEEAARLQANITSKEGERGKLWRMLQETEDQSRTRLQDVQTELEAKKLELETISREREELKAANRGYAEKIDVLSKERDKLVASQKDLEARAAASKKSIAQAEEDLQKLRDEVKAATRHSNNLEEHVADLSNKNKLLEKESRSKLDSTAKQMRDEVDAANSKVEEAQKEKRALRDRVAQLESLLGQSQNRVSELESAAQAAEKEQNTQREELQAQIRALEQRLKEAESAKRSQEEEARRAETQRKEAERKAEEEKAKAGEEAERVRQAEKEKERAEEERRKAEARVQKEVTELAKEIEEVVSKTEEEPGVNRGGDQGDGAESAGAADQALSQDAGGSADESL